MSVPGFDDPALASQLTSENLYFAADQAVMVKNPGEVSPAGYPTAGGTRSEAIDLQLSPLMFGQGAITGDGEPIVHAANASEGHWSEITNFHGSPAPWILIGILLAAGLLMFSAKGTVKAGIRL